MKLFLLAVITSFSLSAFAGSIDNCVTEANIAILDSIAKGNELTEDQETEFLLNSLDVIVSNTELDNKFTPALKEMCTLLDLAAKSIK